MQYQPLGMIGNTSPADDLFDMGKAASYNKRCKCAECTSNLKRLKRRFKPQIIELASLWFLLRIKSPGTVLQGMVEGWDEQRCAKAVGLADFSLDTPKGSRPKKSITSRITEILSCHKDGLRLNELASECLKDLPANKKSKWFDKVYDAVRNLMQEGPLVQDSTERYHLNPEFKK